MGRRGQQEVAQSNKDESSSSKDKRTVFVSQLVMRSTEKDIRRYFQKKVKCKVKEVILLRDRRTGQHKGSAEAIRVREKFRGHE